MRSKFLITILIFMTGMALSSCTLRNDTIDSAPYDGEDQIIGVIGEVPKIREDQVSFETIELENFEKESYNFTYDGIFIMPEYLSDASMDKFADIYRNSLIPIFFIESDKGYIPFIDDEISYDNSPTIDNLSYATGIFVLGEELKYWEFGLYNDVSNKNNIQDVYSRIFRKIQSNIYSDQIEITSSVEKYTPVMSSVPGLPLTVQLNTAEIDDEKEYVWQCEKGEFLTWEKTADKIKLLEGVNIIKSDTIYWRPRNLQWGDSIKVFVGIKELNSNKIIGRKKIEIISNEEGWYILN